MRHLLRVRYLAAVLIAALVVALGIGVALLTRPHPAPQGKLLVLLTVDAPLPAHPTSFQGAATGLRLQHAGGARSWVDVAVRATAVTLPGSWSAPNSDSLFLEPVPAGRYRAAELELRSQAGKRVNDTQQLVLTVAKAGLTPLLFTFQAGAAGSADGVTDTDAYGGNDQVNFGLSVAQGKVMSLPTVPLQNQEGKTVSLQQYRGKVVVVASFLTECQETCPLVAAALLQLQRLVDQQNLQSDVQIVEVTQDPEDDTPAILSKYQKYFGLPWPLLTGSAASVNRFWSQLKVPAIEKKRWNGPAPVDMFTGQPEPYNLVHASVVEVVNQQGYVVSELEDQPTLTSSSLPTTIYKYLDAQGHSELKAGGSWTPKSLLGEISPLLQQKGVYTTLPKTTGVVAVGDPAPDFSLPSTAGGHIALSEEAGHPVMIDFWATWCTNCRADMKLVASTADKYQTQGLKVLLIDFQEHASTASRFLKGLGVGLPSLLDLNGQVAQQYGVPGLPVAVFVSASGKITAIQLGQLDQSEINHDLPTALGS